MKTLTVATLDNRQTTVRGEDFQNLAVQLRGTLIQPPDPSYDDARRLWNGMFDKYPAAIAQCAGVADVIDAVCFARDRNLLVAVRGGAHNVAGLASYDGGFVIDLSQMRAVHVDPLAKTARVEAGAQLGDIDRETQTFGLVVPTGVVSETGIAGLTLSGGLGWLRRKWGMTCDNLIAVELVTADGQWLKASKSEHADLFWALRGGGGNFGVVTAFEFELHPLGPEVMFGFVMYPDHKAILQKYRKVAQSEPEEVSMLSFTGMVPADENFPEAWWHKPFFAVAACYAGPAADGEIVLQPLRELGMPIVDFSARMPYTEVQKFLDADYPKGRNYYWKSLYLKELTDDTIDVLIELNRQAPSHHSTIDIWTMGGAMGRVGVDKSPLSPREAPFMIGIEANWDEAKDSDTRSAQENQRNIAWVQTCIQELKPFAAPGVYLNFPGFMEDADQMVKTAFGNNFQRLVEIKKTYDPDNFFRLNQNIKPAA
ncbi:MAG: FAD-binding oxidoreductase [Cyanobacteria bacterium P01_F01_bin.150]